MQVQKSGDVQLKPVDTQMNARNNYQHHKLNVQMTNGEGEWTSYDQVRENVYRKNREM
jgi:hypothetical protein